MTEYVSRFERHKEDIEKFLNDHTVSSKGMILYSSEVQRLEKNFPSIKISKGNIFRGHLYNCTVTKK